MNQSTLTDSDIRSAIRKHLGGFWPNSQILEEQWEAGPIQENVPGFQVLNVIPTEARRPIVYVTDGCFIVDAAGHIKREFLLISPTAEIQHAETLTMLANFHADAGHRLEVGSIVNIGQPWMPGSQCDHLLISRPYPYGPKLEWLRLADICVRLLWALPVTPREAAFMELNGLEALEQRFDAVKPDYMNPSRTSVV
jgi:hypothetical protein